jgi:hypothetical protein
MSNRRWATVHGKRIEIETVVPSSARTSPRKPLRRDKANRHFGCPMGWLKTVLPLTRSKEQLVVAVYLWRRRVICGNCDTFELPNNELTDLGIDRRIKYRALAHLEAAGVR